MIRPYQPGDEQGICRLFATVFQQELPLAVWQWKYQRDGALPPAFVAEDNGQIVCHYGALRQRFLWQGEERYAWDIVDVMSHPRYQGRGLFRRAAQTFIDWLGMGQSLMFYGFPNERARRLGELLIGYEPVARVYKVRKVLPPTSSPLPQGVVQLDKLPYDWNRHWQHLEERFGLVARRDYAHLTWRYLARPGKQYRILTIPGTASLAVVGVESNRAYLLEFLLAPQEQAGAARLLAGVEGVCRTEGAKEIEGWFVRWAWETNFLTGPGGWTGEEADHYLECRLFEPKLSAAWLSEHLYYSLGDYDVF